MRLYQLSYIAMDDGYYSKYFSAKAEAEKEFKRMSEKRDKILDDYYAEENTAECKQVFEVSTIEFTLSKQGILKMLQIHFSESWS